MALTPSNPGQVSPPNDLTEQSTGSVAIPNDLTEQSAGSVAIPNDLTEQSAGSVAIPNNLTEQSAGTVAIPNDLTEQSAGSVAIPNNLTEQSAGSVAIPNNLTEQAVGTIPRTLDPILKLDFENEVYETTSNQGLDDIVTYSRNSSASFWNRRQDEQGRWETFLDTDYVGSVENLIPYSNDFTDASWLKSNSAVVADTNDFTLFTENSANNSHYLELPDITVTSGNAYTYSVEAKAGTRDVLQIVHGGSAFPNTYANFNLTSGTIVASDSDSSASIVYLGDGIYRCSVTATCTSTQSNQIGFILIGNDDSYARFGAYQGDGSSGLFVRYAQVTESAKPLPYVPTTTTSASETFVESPRLEYDPITAEPLGYLAEGASTNVALRSEEFDNATWQKGNSSISTANAEIAPDGTKSADLFDEGVATSTHYVFQGVTLSASTVYTLSYFVKPITITEINLILQDSANFNNRGQVYFDLTGVGSVGTITNAGDFTATNGAIELVNNGWYRVSITTTTGLATSNLARISSRDGADSYTGTNREMLLWGAQVEELSFASSYIRTESSTVQRNDDDMSAPVAETEIFSVSYEAKHLGFDASTSIYTFALSDGTSANRLLSTVRAGDGLIQHTHVKDSVAISDQSTKSFIDQYRKNTLTQDYEGFSIYIDDELEYNNTGLQPFKVNALQVASRQDNTALYDGYVRIKNINIYEQSLTASEVTLGDSLSGITEAVIPELSAPNNLTEQSVGAVAIPNDLTEQAVGGLPRTFAPLLNLDFANEIYATNDEPSALDDIVTYSRNSSASFWNRRLNRNGKWETFLDTDYVGSVTNLFDYSEQVENASWVKGDLTVITNAIENPIDGIRDAELLVPDAVSAGHFVYNIGTGDSNVLNTFSGYFKRGGYDQVAIRLDHNGSSGYGICDFDLVNGTITRNLDVLTATDTVASIEYVGNDWFRCSITCDTNQVGTDVRAVIYPISNTTYTGDGTSGVYIWGAQLTESAKPLPYVKTLATSASETFVETPRIEYDPITAEPLGLLSEPTSTNLQIYSEEFDNVAYTKTGGAITANDTVAPDGTKSADLYTIDSSTGSHNLADAITFSASEDYTYSIFVKWNSGNTVEQLRMIGGNASIFPLDVRFNMADLTVVETTGTAKITDCGNGWYRLQGTATAGSGGLTNVNLNMFDGGSNSFTGNGTDFFYVWGWQVENLPFASSYIRTLGGSTVQRLKDDLELSSGIVNEARQSITLRGIARQQFLPDTQRFIMSINLDGSGQSFLSSTTGDAFRHRHGETASSTNFTLTANNVDQFYDSVLTFNGSESRLFVNGAFDISNADSGGDVTLSATAIQIGANDGGASTSHWLGNIKRVAIYDEALTDQEVSLL